MSGKDERLCQLSAIANSLLCQPWFFFVFTNFMMAHKVSVTYNLHTYTHIHCHMKKVHIQI